MRTQDNQTRSRSMKVNSGAKKTIPIRLRGGKPVLPLGDSHPKAGEQYRLLRASILQRPNHARMIAVSSPGPGAGKAESSINIAVALALNTGIQVVLVETDLRNPQFHSLFGFSPSAGLAEVLAGECSLDDALLQFEQLPNLYLLPAGRNRLHIDALDLLDSSSWRLTYALLRRRFQFIIVDTAPVTPVADYELLQFKCDGVILVDPPDRPNRKLFSKAVRAVAKEKLIGTILNCMEEWFVGKPGNEFFPLNYT
jgi:capsular exopolysaccharide synthesis family protein